MIQRTQNKALKLDSHLPKKKGYLLQMKALFYLLQMKAL